MDALTTEILEYAKKSEIDLIGFTDAGPVECRPWSYTEDPGHYMPCGITQTGKNTYDPRIILPEALTVVIVGMYMYGFDKLIPSRPGCPRGEIGPWTRGYVEAGRYATDTVVRFLSEKGYKTVFTNQVPYRTLAVKCGLGHIGKNGFLYTEKTGSYIRLGAVLTDAPLETVNFGTESDNNCGNCSLCSKKCPTGALKGENDYDADMCLHLWQQGQGKYGDTIPIERRPMCGQYLMRTGLCLEICPKNRKLVPREHFPFEVEKKEDSPELIPLVLANEEEYRERLPYNVYKYGVENLRRDVIIALGNSKEPAAVPVLSEGLDCLEPVQRRLCAWSLGQIGGSAPKTALREALITEKDIEVCKEIRQALRTCNE